MASQFLGIDLGGSNISAALFTLQGQIVKLEKTPTWAAEGPTSVIKRIVQLGNRVMSQAGKASARVRAVGIGVPGILDLKQGLVRFSPNLPGWKNIRLREQLQAEFRLPIYIENDANAAAYGEKWKGAGQGYDFVVVYTLGTGVGGGIVLDGDVYHGACDGAGELGHMTILPEGPLCSCGNQGCLEMFASGNAIARMAREKLNGYSSSVLYQKVAGRKEDITAKLVFEAARLQDPIAREVIARAGTFLGIAVANIINLLNPQRIIIAGGVSVSGNALLPYVRAEVKRRAMKSLASGVKIVKAKLADRAGVYGAAGIAMHRDQKTRTRREGKFLCLKK